MFQALCWELGYRRTEIVLLKLQCEFKSPGNLVKWKIVTHCVWDGICDPVFGTSSQAMLVLLVWKLHFEKKVSRLVVLNLGCTLEGPGELEKY